jgi:hypothetical protein
MSFSKFFEISLLRIPDYTYIYDVPATKETVMINEHKPAGFASWTAFYNAREAAADRKASVLGALRAAVMIVGGSLFVIGALWVGAFLDFVSAH